VNPIRSNSPTVIAHLAKEKDMATKYDIKKVLAIILADKGGVGKLMNPPIFA
jgi:hypothetical protein